MLRNLGSWGSVALLCLMTSSAFAESAIAGTSELANCSIDGSIDDGAQSATLSPCSQQVAQQVALSVTSDQEVTALAHASKADAAGIERTASQINTELIASNGATSVSVASSITTKSPALALLAVAIISMAALSRRGNLNVDDREL